MLIGVDYKILEIMKNKVLSIMAVVLFMSSSFKAEAINYNCYVASDNLAAAIGAVLHLSYEAEYNLFVELYDNCVDAAEGREYIIPN